MTRPIISREMIPAQHGKQLRVELANSTKFSVEVHRTASERAGIAQVPRKREFLKPAARIRYRRDQMSFSQCLDRLVSLHESINLGGLELRGIYVGDPDATTDYRFFAEPRRSPIRNSTCWKGYIAHFELDAAGILTLRKYVALDDVEQPVDEILSGDFWLVMRGGAPFDGMGEIRIPFKDGKISEDAMTWGGSRHLLGRVRMASHRRGEVAMVGEIKWFGGVNGKTGRTNDYGFISALDCEVYFHRSKTQSSAELLTVGTQILFKRVSGRKGKFEAESVQVLSQMSDANLAAAIISPDSLTAQDTLAVALYRTLLSPCENEVLDAAIALEPKASAQLRAFWTKFEPSSPKDDRYNCAPDYVKQLICQRHYKKFRHALATLFEPLSTVRTALDVDETYRGLNEQDETLAAVWASSTADAAQAKMLSARAAEKAVKRLYEGMGSSVEDCAIRQLEGGSGDWTTHDLLVDGTVAIDVKNSRRPINGENFYVEHTVPRFKLDRRGANVRIAGLLSPYLQLDFIRKPGAIPSSFNVDDLIFLGETSRDSIDSLISKFASDQLEVVRGYERTVPNWVFDYPRAWYSEFVESVRSFNEDVVWPEGEEWLHCLDREERANVIPALCVGGKPLPRDLASKLSRQQVQFYTKVQAMVGNPPELPVIFLAVLSDFLQNVTASPGCLEFGEDEQNYSPTSYLQVLYPDRPRVARNRRATSELRDRGAIASRQTEALAYPLGAIDPLGLVIGLIDTLTLLWESRRQTNLAQYSSFRFSGLGMLQGREREQQTWTTLLAYCGGTIYGTDENGAVLVNDSGKPLSTKGKCGKSPLVIGRDRTCDACGKLICGACGFCTLLCQEKLFHSQAAINRAQQVEGRWPHRPMSKYLFSLPQGAVRKTASGRVHGLNFGL